MKQFVFLPLFSLGIAQPNDFAETHQSLFTNSPINKTIGINAPPDENSTKMPAAVFKAQDYCRAEVKDFEFETQFKVVSAVVYFSGAGFPGVERGNISSNSLKPVKELMNRCKPGTIVIFDEVKVIGPDNLLRTIRGLSLLLI